MATADSDTSWTRVTDEDHPRKRQRLSEEQSPMSSDESIVVEVLPPDEGEDGVTEFPDVIELHEDTDMATSFIDGFALERTTDFTPNAQLDFVYNRLTTGGGISQTHFDNLATWLELHIVNTKSDIPPTKETYALWQQGYDEEAEFFTRLAGVASEILGSGGQAFHNQIDNRARLGQNFQRFFAHVATLSIRIISILPLILDKVRTRRDSGQGGSRQPVGFIHYTKVLAQILSDYGPDFSYAQKELRFETKKMIRRQKQLFLADESALSCLTELLERLGDVYGVVSNSWEGIDEILRIFTFLDHDASEVAGRAMATIHNSLLPAICEKHPKSLPDDFHILLVDTGGILLSILTEDPNGWDHFSRIYKQYIESDGDALLTMPEEGSITEALRRLSNDNKDTLTALLKTSWNLYAFKSYIFSGIMDVRASGIAQLNSLLLQAFNDYKESEEGFDHPVVQYIGRFMRTNELTKYIFGPESHASLISHSQNIVGFLAATLAYTDSETDVIWAACTTKGEAEVAKASFGVLNDLCRYLDLDHLLYLAKKYTTTPPGLLCNKDAVETLNDLFRRVQLGSKNDTDDQDRRLATAWISIDILRKLNAAENNTSTSQLRTTARNELLRFAEKDYTDDRHEIYKRCIPQLLKPDGHSTTSIEIILLFLQSPIVRNCDSQDLLKMLPVGAVVDELAQYVEMCRNDKPQSEHASILAIQLRTELVVQMMALPGATTSQLTLSSFFKCVVGKLAISNAARDGTWSAMANMTHLDVTGASALTLLNYCLEESVRLPSELLTPALLNLYGKSLQMKSQSPALQDDYTLVLQTPIWEKLLRIAESTSHPQLCDLARRMLCDVLFRYPLLDTDSRRCNAAKCHASFARQQINCIHEAFASRGRSPTKSQAKIQDVCQKIDLLASILRSSKECQSAFEPTTLQDVLLASEEADDVFQCTVAVYGGSGAQAKLYRVHADETTKLSDLASKLPSFTGASSNRVVIAGQELDMVSQAGKTMTELGIGPAGVISISPKHTFQSDLGMLLTSVGEVEKEVLAQYSELEDLLDGPDDVARKIFEFLLEIRPPAQPRQRVMSAESSPRSLFPQDRTWRSAFTIHVLRTHLEDYARLGVADEGFLLHGIRLLVGIITDKTRQIDTIIFPRAMTALGMFLREKPSSPTTAAPIESDAEFVARMIDACYYFLRLPVDTPAPKQFMIELTFRTLMEAFRRQDSVWQRFKEHAQVTDMHRQVLLHEDTMLACSVTNMLQNFCTDHSSGGEEVADFYMTMSLNILPNALKREVHKKQLFQFATKTLLVNRLLRADETRSREIALALMSTLLTYEHTESLDLLVKDICMAGLLKLVSEAINVVKSFKTPLYFSGVATKLFATLLFPPLKEANSRPLVNQTSRALAYDLVKSLCETQADYIGLLDATLLPLRDASDNPSVQFPGRAGWHRPASQCSGLDNLGQTCYMNSLLQQLFANVHFRKFIFETKIVDLAKQGLLHNLQRLFANMQDNYNLSSWTGDLAASLKIQTDTQEDVHSFYADFLHQLEASMPDENSKRDLLRFYTGSTISQIRGECGHTSSTPESCVDIPIVVKNKASLQDSLREFVKGEPMEGANKYKCLSCDPNGSGRLVDAVKRTCLDKVPDNITFCLKRFEYLAWQGSDSKVNDRFEFPQTIDISRSQIAHLEIMDAEIDEDLFELVGVIVHSGTLTTGHYWSYTLLRNTHLPAARSWLRLEDQTASICQGGIEEVQRECFGGLRNNGHVRADNAYVLFYQRKASLEEQISLPGDVHDPDTHCLLPPKVPIPVGLQNQIHESNETLIRIATLFDEDFSAHVHWLLEISNKLRPTTPPQSESGSPEGEDGQQGAPKTNEEHLVDQFALDLSELAILYIYRVAACTGFGDVAERRLARCIRPLKTLMATQPRLVTYVFERLARRHLWFTGPVHINNRRVRDGIEGFTSYCLAIIHDQDQSFYQEAFLRIAKAHSSLMLAMESSSPPILVEQLDWEHYLGFAADLAEKGPWETATILDKEYLLWARLTLYTPFDIDRRKQFPHLSEHLRNRENNRKVSALFDFIRRILSGHVVLPDDGDQDMSAYPHQHTESGALLQPPDLAWLRRTSANNQSCWMKMARHARITIDWKDFAPGKLLALLMSPKYADEYADWVATSLQKHIDLENEDLKSITHLVMHFCANVEKDSEAVDIFNSLASSILLWPDSQLEWLKVVRQAYQLTPAAVVSSVEHWCHEYLMDSEKSVSENTSKWLREAVLEPEPFPTDTMLGFWRLTSTVKLVGKCIARVQDGVHKNKAKVGFQPLIQIMEAADQYSRRLNDVLNNAKIDDEEWSDAAQHLVQGLKEFRELTDSWEADEEDEEIDHVQALVDEVDEDMSTASEEDWEDDSDELK